MVFVGENATDPDVEGDPQEEDLSKMKQKLTKTGPERGLFWYNIVVSLAHFAQFLFLGFSKSTYSLQLYVYYSLWVQKNPGYECFATLPGGGKNTCTVQQTRAKATMLNLKWSVTMFFFLSFIFQFAAVMRFDSYLYLVRNGIQVWRYVEYSVSASLMTVIFAALVGIDDVFVLQNLFIGTTAVMILGLSGELIHFYQKLASIKDGLLARAARGIPIFTAWLVFLLSWFYVGGRFIYSIHFSNKTPRSLYGIIFAEFFLFLLFGINGALASIGLISRVTSEYFYVTLSLTAKSVLAWILYSSYAFRNSKNLTYGPPICSA